MTTVRLRIAYEGTNYAGWQVQPQQRTVQGEIERALQELTGEQISILCAGRTDSGVHALGQVASFRSNFRIDPVRWRPALQSRLPEDIVILESDQVPDDFHATYSAVSKRYRYVIDNSIIAHPFWRKFSWKISQPLDAEAMHAAAQCLVGKHDFRSFESHWPNKATSVRTVSELSIRRLPAWDLWSPAAVLKPHPERHRPRLRLDGATDNQDEQMSGPAGDFLCLEIEADGFLYNMVRTITGTLVNVGRGTWSAADVERILHAQDRKIAGGTAPAQGLYLAQVYYEI